MMLASAPRLAPSCTAAVRSGPMAAVARPVQLSRCSSLLPRIVSPYHSAPRPVALCAAVEEVEPSNRLYVGNLSWNTTAEDLGKHFAQADGFKAANVAFDPRRQTSKGFGFVEFASVEAAERAREVMAETELDGRNLLVQPAAPRRERPPRQQRDYDREDNRGFDRRREGRRDNYDGERRSNFDGERRMGRERVQRDVAPGTRVFVSNLPYSADWQEIKDAFRQAGEVAFVDMLTRRLDDGRIVKRGSAIVAFTDAESAEQAVDIMNGQELDGRPMTVRMFNDQQPA